MHSISISKPAPQDDSLAENIKERYRIIRKLADMPAIGQKDPYSGLMMLVEWLSDRITILEEDLESRMHEK